MRLLLFIGWRYLATKRKEKFISLISVISVLGVAIGVMALIVVLAVMSGFDRDLRDKIVGNYAHVTVSSFSGMSRADYADVSRRLLSQRDVVAVSPFVQGQMLVEEGSRFFAVSFKGIDPAAEKKVTRTAGYLVKGSLDDLSDDTAVIGKELALYLGADVGSQIQVYSALGKKHRLKVTGIFRSGMYEYDMNLVFLNLATAQSILGAPDSFSAVAVRLTDMNAADSAKARLQKLLGYSYSLKTWTEANANFFAALKLEKITMFIILTLIILVASFNIISTLVVTVVEKTKDIAILKSIGMSADMIKKIFTILGLVIGLGGTFVGASAGVVLCFLLKKYQFIKLPQDIYYIDRLPVALQLWPDVALIVLAALAITLVSTLYPAAKASQLKPVEGLRYE